MAQYLISLTNTLELTLRSDGFPHFHAKEHVIALYRKLRHLKALVDDSSPLAGTEEVMESRIRDVACITEDVIESATIQQLLSQVMGNSSGHLDPGLLSALELAAVQLDLTVEELMNDRCGLKRLLPRKYLPIGSSRAAPSSQNVMVGFDEDMLTLKDRLTGLSSGLQTIPIVGMGGCGKTTLAINIYNDSLIKYHFDVRAFVTISQTYHIKEVLLGLLQDKGVIIDKLEENSSEDLRQTLYRYLKGRRYLLVLDDMWNITVWDDLKMLFPDDVNGSRIILTSRLLDVAVHATDRSSPPHEICLLDEENSWNLLCQEAFAMEGCPPELEEPGRLISRNCKGLPLAITVIGRLLAHHGRTWEFWKNVAENLSSIANNTDEHYSEILSLSYNHLPHHLKPCFLYFGLFPEDYYIYAPKLIRLWAAEGFLKPINSKGWEEAAEEYLLDLIARNLVSVHQRGSNGKIKMCGMHDLLRDLCVKEGQKEKFLQNINRDVQSFQEDMKLQRRLSIHLKILQDDDISDDLRNAMKSMSLLRSLLCTRDVLFVFPFYHFFPLLRVLDVVGTQYTSFPIDILLLLNLRYLAFSFRCFPVIPPQLSQLWKLQTLIVQDYENLFNKQMYPYLEPYFKVDMPSELLGMTQLRNLRLTECYLPSPLDGGSNSGVMYLETLSMVANFRCTEEFLQKFPNLRKLGVYYYASCITNWTNYHLQNVVHLRKLENLKCIFNGLRNDISSLNLIMLPHSLKKLTLSGSLLLWEDMGIIGSLPNLEVLKLKAYAFFGTVWQPLEGEFCRLKFLLIQEMNLVKWIADKTHFPCLEHLIIKICADLEEIPSGIGDIATLQRIEIDACSSSVVDSAENILEEQRSMENYVFQVCIGPTIFDL